MRLVFTLDHSSAHSEIMIILSKTSQMKKDKYYTISFFMQSKPQTKQTQTHRYTEQMAW